MNINEEKFYEQACSYFYYHAEQRTNMINYFTVVFGAGLALYGTLIKEYTVAAAMISLFMACISTLFYLIDQRNKFDVKQSQTVISEFEKACGLHKPVTENGYKADCAFGVFSNENDVFKYYDLKFRITNRDYNALLKNFRLLQKKKRQLLHRNNTDKIKQQIAELEQNHQTLLDKCLENDKTVSKSTLESSIKEHFIIHLSTSIKWLYYACIAISGLMFIAAVFFLNL